MYLKMNQSNLSQYPFPSQIPDLYDGIHFVLDSAQGKDQLQVLVMCGYTGSNHPVEWTLFQRRSR
jgi:hypothetical protein